MKTKFFKTLFVLLISLPFGEGWGGVLLSAQNGVIVSGLAVDAGTVTFNVNWNKNDVPPLWSDSVWVFVDYNVSGKMERLPLITSGATLTTTSVPSVGKVMEVSGNDKGVWVVGNARSASSGSFSATVRLLTATADIAGACAYASNYPPVGEYISDTEIAFTGTPMYNLVLAHNDGSTVTVQSGGTFLLPCSYTLQSFTDATTGAQGIMKCIPMTGSIDFSVPSNISKGTTASFVVNKQPATLNSASITYLWSASGFSPTTYAGHTYTPTAPGVPGTYPVTLTAQSEGYCDLVITKNVEVIDCHAPSSTGVTFANFSPCDGASYGVTYTLTDDRDQKTYKVKYMPDGRYWMVQDLKFGTCNASSLNKDNTEGATTVTPTVAIGYVGHCTAATSTGTPSNRGYLYNWPAAMNNTKAYYGSTYTGLQCTGIGKGTASPNPGACQGICPNGWHIPTGTISGEFYDANTKFRAAYGCSNNNCWNASSQWEGVLGGFYNNDAGAFLSSQGDFALYWSSTCYSNSHVYSLWITTASVYPGTNANDGKYAGYTVRCVKNY